MEDFQKKISQPLLNWDYLDLGYHFFTLCTLDKTHYFGEVRNQIMGLSVQGCIARLCWSLIPYQFPQVQVGSVMVMPNHLHGIMQIIQNPRGRRDPGRNNRAKKNPSVSIIRYYKRSVMRFCHSEGLMVMWESGHQDQVIRDEASLKKLQKFIQTETIHWDEALNNIW